MTRQQRLARVKERYLRDGYARRLGGLAANLARVASFSDDGRHGAAVEDLIVESEHFIEWVVPTAPRADQEHLVWVQRQLAWWRCRMAEVWADDAQRRQVAAVAQGLAAQVLGMSGLVAAGHG